MDRRLGWVLAATLCVALGCSSTGNSPPPTTTTSTSGSPDAGTPNHSCVAITCAQAGRMCGELNDGCGLILNCGGCADGQQCNAAGACEAIPTNCTPKSCESQQASCGSIDNGCGGTLSCGTCSAGQQCNSNHACEPIQNQCVPKSCAQAGATCGTVDNGCGGTLSCGGCSSGQDCGTDHACHATTTQTQSGQPMWTEFVDNGWVEAVTVDSAGNLFTGGRENNTFQVRKWSAAGALLMNHAYPDSNSPDLRDIAISPLGNIFLALSGNCPNAGCNATYWGGQGYSSAIVKLSPAGDFVWAQPTGREGAGGVAVDSKGQPTSIGLTGASGLSSQMKHFSYDGQLLWSQEETVQDNPVLLPGDRIMVAAMGGRSVRVLDSSGATVSETAFSGSGYEYIEQLASSPTGLVSLTGSFSGPVTWGAQTLSDSGLFLATANSSGAAQKAISLGEWTWAFSANNGSTIAVSQGSSTGCEQGTIKTYDSNLNARWSTTLRSSCDQDHWAYVSSLAVLSDGSVVVVGAARGPFLGHGADGVTTGFVVRLAP